MFSYIFLLAKDPNPRDAFMQELRQFIQGLRKEKNHLIVLGIDANEQMTPGSKIDDLRLSCGLIDPQVKIHGPTQSPSYARGSSKIDHILISEELMPAVESTGTLEHHGLGIVSDHMGIFIAFNEKKMYKGNIADLLKVENRDVTSTIPRIREKYKEEHREQLRQCNLIQRFRDVESCPDPNEAQRQYNAIARDLIAANKVAGKRCRKKGRKRFPFSPKLKSSMELVQYWKTRKTCVLTSLDRPQHLTEIRSRHNFIDDAGNNLQAITIRLHEAKTRLKAAEANCKELRR